MFALTMTMTLRPGTAVDGLIDELESTPSTSRRTQLMRKLARLGQPEAIDAMASFLAPEGRTFWVCIEAIASFGEDARRPMLDIVADPRRSELHRGALLVLAKVVTAPRRPT
jgi:hypothetical protein